MSRTALIVLVALSIVTPTVAAGADFHLAYIEGGVANVLKAAQPKPGPDGVGRLSLYGARRRPAPDGRAIYSRMQYAFRCGVPAVRAEGFYVYDIAFKEVFAQRKTSPWRALPNTNHMPELHRFACGGPLPASTKPLVGASWQAALQQARANLR